MTEILTEPQYAEWDSFVQKARGGTIFHTSYHLCPIADDLQVRVLRDKSGQIEAGMAITPSKFLGTTAARRPPWTVYNGPLILPSDRENRAERISEEKDRMVRLLAESPAMGMYDYIFAPEYTDLMPFIWNGFDTLVAYTYQISQAPPEQWHAEMSKNHKKNLRRARNALKELDATIEVNSEPEEFLAMAQELRDTSKFRMELDPEKFQRWWVNLRARDAISLYLLRDGEGQALTGNIVVHDWTCSYAIIGGVRGGRLTGPAGYVHRLVFEKIILDAHERGLTFDFEGSVLPGVEPYFRGWGGVCRPKYRVVKARRPWAYAAWCSRRYWTGHRKKAWFAR